MDIRRIEMPIDVQELDVFSHLDFVKHVPWLNFRVFGNSLYAYVLTGISFVAIWAVLRLARLLLVRWLDKRPNGKSADAAQYAASLGKLIWPGVLPLVALYLALGRLEIPGSLDKALKIITLTVVTLQLRSLAADLVAYLIRRSRLTGRENDAMARASTQNIVTIAQLVLWVAAALFLLDNAGVNISTFVAGLGIGGVAIALAAQAILGDTFSSFAIALDKPFEVGDFIAVDGLLGTVEMVGFKTTRVRSLSGELLVFSNSDLTKSRIKNYQKMRERRVVFSLGVTYQTTPQQLRAIPQLIKQAIESVSPTRFDRSHFLSYGDSALMFETVFYVLAADYNVYMDAMQAINLKIFEDFAAQGIDFAYPTRTVHTVTD